jgi:hypothetical protein
VVADEAEAEGKPPLPRSRAPRSRRSRARARPRRRARRTRAPAGGPSGRGSPAPSGRRCAVGAREVDVLEDATGLRNAGRVLAAGDAVFGDHDQFAGQHVALVLGAEQIEGAGLAGEDDGVGAVGIRMRPMESGRKPRGSRAAKMRSRVIMTMEKAPSTWRASRRWRRPACRRWSAR